jgi:hypothetical protein
MRQRWAYLRCLGLTLASVLAAVVAFNVVIDPFAYFGAPRIRGLSALKVQPGPELVAVKKAAMRRTLPDALIVGNSRAEVGFDPEHRGWRVRGLEPYNAAVRAADLYASVVMLQTARRSREPRVLVLGLDFLDFLTRPDARTQAFPDAAIESSAETARRWLRAVATLGGLLQSIRTVVAQRDPYPELITERGFNPLLDYHEIARVEGYHAMFQQRARENARAYIGKPSALYVAGTQSSPAFDLIQTLVDQASRRQTEVHLAIYPYHAQILIMFEAAGLWSGFEQWKRHLTEIAARGGAQVALWDFSGFSEYATEAIPPPGDRATEVQWYWEAGHFKKALGDVMLERMLLTDATREGEGFGARLTPANVDAHLLKMRQARDAFRASNVSLVAEVEELVSRARRASSN